MVDARALGRAAAAAQGAHRLPAPQFAAGHLRRLQQARGFIKGRPAGQGPGPRRKEEAAEELEAEAKEEISEDSPDDVKEEKEGES